MPDFSYVALSMSGNEIRGKHSAPDKNGVINMLHRQGYYPTSIKKGSSFLEMSIGTAKLPIKIAARLCTQMSSMLRAGVPIVRALKILASESEHRQLKKILDDVNSSIEQGSSLSQAVTPHRESFPLMFHSMVEAGEASGTLDSCLSRAGESFTRTAKLNAKVKGAMIYPSIIFIVLIGLIIVMLTFVVPQFADIFQQGGQELPAFTLRLLNANEFIVSRWYLILAMVAAVIILFVTFLRTDIGSISFDKMKTRLPLTGRLIRKVYAARFTRSLSSLVAAGVNLPQALDISNRTIGNKFLEKSLKTVVDDVKGGMHLSDAIERVGQLPNLVTNATKIGEESGELEEMLIQLAEYYDDEADSAVQAMLAIMEPALILIMAAIVVPILFGVLQPMFGMIDAASYF
ncbi:MAG: type II secretion system F family protein [Defluviitaleaceae bacterium]|nr:type II secretion system F family protein [Defluviitaleaceae bacterium]